jgi:WD40 repeat protein
MLDRSFSIKFCEDSGECMGASSSKAVIPATSRPVKIGLVGEIRSAVLSENKAFVLIIYEDESLNIFNSSNGNCIVEKRAAPNTRFLGCALNKNEYLCLIIQPDDGMPYFYGLALKALLAGQTLTLDISHIKKNFIKPLYPYKAKPYHIPYCALTMDGSKLRIPNAFEQIDYLKIDTSELDVKITVEIYHKSDEFYSHMSCYSYLPHCLLIGSKSGALEVIRFFPWSYKLPLRHKEMIKCIAFNNNIIVSAAGRELAFTQFNPRSYLLTSLPISSDFEANITSCEISQDGSTLAIVLINRTLKIYDIASHQILRSFRTEQIFKILNDQSKSLIVVYMDSRVASIPWEDVKSQGLPEQSIRPCEPEFNPAGPIN